MKAVVKSEELCVGCVFGFCEMVLELKVSYVECYGDVVGEGLRAVVGDIREKE